MVSLAAASCTGWGVYSSHRFLFPRRPAPGAPAARASLITHELTAPDGARFLLWLLEGVSPRALLLLYHGYCADRSQVLGMAERFCQRGYDVALPELRGHGTRAGPCTFGTREVEEAGVVLRWAAMRRRPDPPIAVMGLSMGAAIACRVALSCPQVRAVVTDSIYDRLFPVLQRGIRETFRLPAVPWAWVTWWWVQAAVGAGLARFDPVRLAPQIRRPLLAIQGGADQRLAPALGEQFYERWAGPKERWFEADAPHVGMYARDPERYCERVARFLDEALSDGHAS